jgi:hypothetical protein
MKYFFITAIATALLIACNNSEDESPVTTETSHDSHAATTNTAVPDTEIPPAGAKVFFKNLKPGQTISSTYKLEMGVEGMRIDTAGPLVSGAGHHHLMIDGPDSLAIGTVVKKDSVNIHFGKGQTEYELKLSPGKHKLTLQFADGAHRSYGGQMSATTEVNVKQ